MAKETPSLVLLDLIMPEMDGFEVLVQMRTSQRTRQVPVLILSGKMLTLEEVKRIESYAKVKVQSKGILTEDQVAAYLQRVLIDGDTLPPQTAALVKRALAYFHQNYDRPFSRREMAETLGISEDYFSRIFRRELALSPWEYLNRYRIKRAMELLRCTSDTVTDIAFQVGFNSLTYFERVFHKLTGLSPSAYREQLR